MKIKYISVFLFVGYIILSLLFNEFHPFSKYPMYNSFPNYAYTFYVSDEQGKLVPLQGHFQMQANELSHLYTTICETKNIKHGNGMESDEELGIIGKEMLERIISSKKGTLKNDSLSIHREYYYFENGNIIKDDRELYTANVE